MKNLDNLLFNYEFGQNLSGDLIEKWIEFINNLLAPRFNNQIINFDNISTSKLFKDAYNWINIIKNQTS